MSFTEYNDCFVWSCNGEGCEKEVMFKPHDFMACVAELKARGWQIVCDEDHGYEGCGRTWRHYCQRCQYKRRQIPLMERKFSTVKGAKE